jgi:hypothetical protein
MPQLGFFGVGGVGFVGGRGLIGFGGFGGALGAPGGALGFGGGIPVTAMTFAPDGKSLAFGLGDTIYLWGLARRREIRRFGGEQVSASSIAFSPDGKALAAGSLDGKVHVWSADTGTPLCEAEGHRGPVTSVSFAANGKLLASGGSDTTALIWDVKSLLDDRRPRHAALSPSRLEALWTDLGDADAARAYDAVWALAAAPAQTTGFLQGRLHPAAAVDPQRVVRLVADLDSERYEQRKRATDELQKLGDAAEAALRKVLAGKPSLEIRQRAEQLLQKLEEPVTDPERLRALRSVEVLGQIDTPEARQLLEKLAKGAPESRLTQQAQEALERLK